MTTSTDRWRFTVRDLIRVQHDFIESAADLCEFHYEATTEDIISMIRSMHDKAIDAEVESYADSQEEPLKLDLTADKSTWRFWAGDMRDYAAEAKEKVLEVCQVEQSATPEELATMIRSLIQKDRLI